MKIVLVISSLEPGGAERVMSILANELARRHTVVLITLSSSESDFYAVSDTVRRVALGLQKASSNPLRRSALILRRVVGLRRVFLSERADVIVSFADTTNIMSLMATIGMSTPVVVSERVDPEAQKVPRLVALLRRLFYRRAATIVAQTERASRVIATFSGSVPIRVIPNPLSPHVAQTRGVPSDEREHVVLAAGRLTPQKGFDLLLQAFQRCSSSIPGWRLVIYGRGEDRKRLFAMVDDLALSQVVELAGIADLTGPMRRAAIFALSSRYEGFPNVLLEAMASGCAVVAFDCPSGPAEIVRPGVDGLLVPCGNADALADALASLMSDVRLRHDLSSQAPGVADRFGLEPVMGLWDGLLAEVTR